MKIFHFFQQFQKSLQKPFMPSLILGFSDLPTFDKNQISNFLPQIEPLNSSIEISYENENDNHSTFLATIKFENHQIYLLGNPSSFSDDLIQTCIEPSHWGEKYKKQILSSKATINLVYTGDSTDTVENYIALYKVAACFYNENLLGIVNEPAWTYHPAEILPKLLFNNMLNVCRNSPPFLFWTGFVKASLNPSQTLYDKNVQTMCCFLTKGHHVFGFPDLALFGTHSDALRIQKIFNDIIEYAWYEKKELLPGDLIGFSENEIYELVEPDEKLKLLESPLKTFILKKID